MADLGPDRLLRHPHGGGEAGGGGGIPDEPDLSLAALDPGLVGRLLLLLRRSPLPLGRRLAPKGEPNWLRADHGWPCLSRRVDSNNTTMQTSMHISSQELCADARRNGNNMQRVVAEIRHGRRTRSKCNVRTRASHARTMIYFICRVCPMFGGPAPSRTQLSHPRELPLSSSKQRGQRHGGVAVDDEFLEHGRIDRPCLRAKIFT